MTICPQNLSLAQNPQPQPQNPEPQPQINDPALQKQICLGRIP